MTIDSINEQLKTVMYPGFTKDILSFGFVKDVKIDGDDAVISLEITSSAGEVANL